MTAAGPTKLLSGDYANALEPRALIQAFLNYPPEGFTPHPIEAGGCRIPGFLADLDLTTTLDEDAKRRVDAWRRRPLVDWVCRAWFTPRVLFAGTTVSEYGWLPKAMDFPAFARELPAKLAYLPGRFFILKDMPEQSPFLSASENEAAHSLLSLLESEGFLVVAGQALAYLPIDFNSVEAYLDRLSKPRRKDFRRKRKLAEGLRIEECETGHAFFSDARCDALYGLYEHAYVTSDVHFDKLTSAFFRRVFQDASGGIVFLYFKGESLIGFNLCYVHGPHLVDKYWGLAPEAAREHALFFNSFFYNLDYCLRHGLRACILGCTAARVKASLGCRFTYTTHAVYIKNPLLRGILRFFKSRFEGDRMLVEELVP